MNKKKQCPICKKMVDEKAIKCPYCKTAYFNVPKEEKIKNKKR